MTLEIYVVLGIIVFALICFSLELMRSDLVAICVMSLLILFGIVTADDAVKGFSSSATVTVACMFIISAAFVKAGLVGLAAKVFSFWRNPNAMLATFFMMVVVGVISAFINNTATVAVFIPIAIKLAHASGISRKQILMPLSFAAIFGGACTLIGTSTNILINSIFVSRGFAGFNMFEFAAVGCLLATIGIVYMMTIGRGLLKTVTDVEESVEPRGYLTEVELRDDSPSANKALIESPFFKDFETNIVSMSRNSQPMTLSENPVLQSGDTFLLICNIEKIANLKDRSGLSILENKTATHAMPKDMEIYEVVVPAHSELVGHRIQHSGLVRLRGIIPLAVRHGKKALFRLFDNAYIQAGDVLVVAGKPEIFENFKHDENLLVLSQAKINRVNWPKIALTAFLTVALILFSSLGFISVLGAAVIVTATLILTRTISLKEAYDSLDGQVLILLSCMISLGFALEKTGGASAIANLLVDYAGSMGPYFIISVLYLSTSLLTEVMSNNATAVLMAPIAIDISNAMNLGPKPFLVAVMLAGSASFMTPVGYQTNTLIYAPGGYKFTDFLKVGTPLNILFWLAATFLIPIFIPF